MDTDERGRSVAPEIESLRRGDAEDPDLSAGDVQRYETLKGKLYAAEKQQAEVLWEIKRDRLHLAEYDTYEGFVEAEVGYSRRQADRLANWGHLLDILGPDGPACEAHARPLASVDDEEDLRQIWNLVEEQDAAVTSTLVREARSRHYMESVDESSEDGTTSGTDDPGLAADGWGAADGGSAEGTASGEASASRPGSPSAENPSGQPADGNGHDSDTGDDDDPPEGTGDQPESGVSPDVEEHEPTSSRLTPRDEGANIQVDPDVARALGIGASSGDDGGPVLVDEGGVERAELRRVIGAATTVDRPLPKSSGEDGVADSIWRPLVRSVDTFDGALPDAAPASTVILRPREIGRLSSPRVSADADRVLICPGIDLFAPVVPDLFVTHVLDSLDDVEVHPILFTRHLGRAAEFDLPDGVWLGTAANRQSLESAQKALEDAGNPKVRWVLYDVAKADREEGPPSFSGDLDWIVLDPPEGAGISLRLDEAFALREAADEAEAAYAFRHDFKTFGASYPA